MGVGIKGRLPNTHAARTKHLHFVPFLHHLMYTTIDLYTTAAELRYILICAELAW